MESNQQNNSPKKRKTGSIITGIVLILIIAGIGTWWYIHHTEIVSTDDAYVDAYKVTVSSQIPGRILKLYAHEGEIVKKGQLLVQLDTADYTARIKQAAAGLKEAKLGIKLAQVRLEQSEINYKRAKKQYDEKLIPEAQYINLKKEYEATKIELSLAKAKMPIITSSMYTMRTTLSQTKIYAPMDGVVAKRWALAGDVVAPGQGIFTIFDTQQHWVTAMLPEKELQKINLGDTVDIHVDAFALTSFKGVIYQIGSSTASQFSLIPPDNASGNFTKVSQRIPIKMTIFETTEKSAQRKNLLPGMSVEIKVKAKKNEPGTKS